jgi:hypothetical protein
MGSTGRSTVFRSLPGHVVRADAVDTLLTPFGCVLHADLRRLVPAAMRTLRAAGTQCACCAEHQALSQWFKPDGWPGRVSGCAWCGLHPPMRGPLLAASSRTISRRRSARVEPSAHFSITFLRPGTRPVVPA